MKAIVYADFGGPEVLTIQEVNAPVVKDDEVLIKVAATTVNRIDLWQRIGSYKQKYPLGLECSGKIQSTGKFVTGWKEGDEVCALVPGGGAYADLVAVPAKHIISAPKNLNLAYAAALPCAACIIWQCFFVMNKLIGGEKILIHGGAGGVGSLAIQIAKHYGCQVFTTAGSKERVQFCASLGADVCINHKEEDFAIRVNAETKGTGVDYIIDSRGSFVRQNLRSLAFGGKLIIIGYEDNWGCPSVNCMALGFKQQELMGVDLTSLTPMEQEWLLQRVKEEMWPLIENGSIIPRVSKTYMFHEVAEAHRLMEKNGHLGKILLIPPNP